MTDRYPTETEVGGFVPAEPWGRGRRAVASLALAEDDSEHPRLDRVTRLATMLFDVPISTVTVLEGSRAWYPSAQGIREREAVSEQTFCATVVAENRSIVVADARTDERFRALEAVQDGSIRFYAGRPLRDRDGNVLGSFCIIAGEPRTLAAADETAFEELAQLAEQELVASTEKAAVSAIQTVLQPEGSDAVDDWRVEAVCLPALAVGGDFFDYAVSPEGLMVCLGDVMGKGTTAALLGAGVRGTLRGVRPQVLAGGDLGESLGVVARAVFPDLGRAQSFVTVFEAVIDPADGTTRWLDAGSGLCVVRRADGTVEQLAGDDHPLGLWEEDTWTEQRAVLSPGDRLLVFSDGLLDLLDDQARWLGPVGGLLAAHDDPAALVQTIRRLTAERTGIDDVTVVAVYRDPAA